MHNSIPVINLQMHVNSSEFLASHDNSNNKDKSGIRDIQKTAAPDQHREVILQLPLQSVAGNVTALIHLA